jgi:hypothetical protein
MLEFVPVMDVILAAAVIAFVRWPKVFIGRPTAKSQYAGELMERGAARLV